MQCRTAEMIVLLPVVWGLVLLPPLRRLWVSLGLRLMMMMKWNWFQKLKRPKKIPQRSPETKSETKQLKVDTEQMMKAKGQICSQILERQRKIVSLESDSSTLAQTLELIQQEKASLSSKLLEMRTYFTKVGEEINAKLQKQQDWLNSHKISRKLGEHVLVKDRVGEKQAKQRGV